MQRLSEKIKRKHDFIQLLQRLDVDSLNISDYNKIYFKKHVHCLTYSVNLALQIIETGFRDIDKPIESISILEIGGGTGILSLLAKWLGFGKVVYSDTFKISCEDFEIISKALSLATDKIIVGGIDEVFEHNTSIDLIVSRDVIEHIYDPEAFFKTCCKNYEKSVMVHNTSANLYNLFQMSYFRRIQQKDELEGNANQFKPGDSQESHYTLRYNFIKSILADLDENIIAKLASLTRGKMYSDIEKSVYEFKVSGKFPTELAHSTNTCDPANGNWTEHLLPFEAYESFVDKHKFRIDWKYAPYDAWRNVGLKKLVILILNFLIRNTGLLARYLSPAIILKISPKLQSKQE